MSRAKMTLLGLMLAFIVVGPVWTVVSRADPASGASGPVAGDAAKLTRTLVSSHLDAEITAGRNLLWCATFQLVWNELGDLVGAPVRLEGDPAAVAALNRRAVNEDDIDAGSVLTVAGFAKDGLAGKIQGLLAKKFSNEAKPSIDLASLNLPPESLVAYAYLQKALDFPVPFEEHQSGLRFGEREVTAFGVGEYKESQEAMVSQVMIHDYTSADDFVIELKTKNPQDQLILAKTPPAKTLDATIDAVAKRLAGAEAPTMRPGDVLAIPKMDLDVFETYEDLEGKKLVDGGPKAAGTFVALAVQAIRFQLNEEGVRLQSEAASGFACSSKPRPTHHMQFDKPFLLMLKRQSAAKPYFAAWVDNPELLVRR